MVITKLVEPIHDETGNVIMQERDADMALDSLFSVLVSPIYVYDPYDTIYNLDREVLIMFREQSYKEFCEMKRVAADEGYTKEEISKMLHGYLLQLFQEL